MAKKDKGTNNDLQDRWMDKGTNNDLQDRWKDKGTNNDLQDRWKDKGTNNDLQDRWMHVFWNVNSSCSTSGNRRVIVKRNEHHFTNVLKPI